MGLINLLPFLSALQKSTPDSAGTPSGMGSGGGAPQQGASPDDSGWNPQNYFRNPPPPPPPPSPPGPPAALNPGTPQNNLVQIQEEARNNEAYQPEPRSTPNSRTFCNIATAWQVDQAGGNVTPLRGAKGQDIVVNDQFKNLNQPGSGYHQGSDEEAQAYTNRTGIPALAIQPNPNGHGHIVPLVPEVFPGQPHPEGWSPQVNNIGRRVGITTADDAFPNKNLPMYYFVPDR